MSPGRSVELRTARRLVRRLGRRALSLIRRIGLEERVLLVAGLILGLAMYGLGSIIAVELRTNIVAGIADSTAASIDILLAHELNQLGKVGPLDAAGRAKMDAIFSVASDAPSPRLLQVRVFDSSGRLIYQSLGGLIDPQGSAEAINQALAGTVSSRLGAFPLKPLGPLAEAPVTALKLVTPLHRPGTAEVMGAAELFYGGHALLQRQTQATRAVWASVGLIGGLVAIGLYVLVRRTARVIREQRARLATNLATARRLTRDNRALRVASEELRRQAGLANERLLAEVGAELHDGPIQLLTLLVLQLGRRRGAGSTDEAPLRLASDAMAELRNISNGLVLPELATVNLADTILMAVARHQQTTGNAVACALGALPEEADADVKTCVYRVLQEGLTNAFLHGGPGARVSASVEAGRLVLAIANPLRPGGEGSPPARRRLGLSGMRFRVESLGGELRTDLPEAGTASVTAYLPLAPAVRGSSAHGSVPACP